MYKSNLVVINKFSTLTRPVELYDPSFSVSQNSLNNALITYQIASAKVYLLVNDQFHLAGKMHDTYLGETTVDLLDNMYGSFVQRMLYHAVDYKLLAKGLGQVSNDTNALLGFKINQLIITNYTKWF